MTYFTKSHEWIAVGSSPKSRKVGITHFAQKELGEIVFVQLPKVGQKVEMGEQIVVLESTKAAADVYSPVSGKVVKINEALNQDPQLINRSAESQGWLFEIELSLPAEEKKLLSKEEYQKLSGG